MRNRTTFILLLIVLASAISAALAFVHLEHNRALAERQQNDLHQSLRLISDLESNKSPARLIATRLDGSDMNRRIRDAANSAAISDHLSSVEPACRIKSIELESPPDPSETTNWASDLTLAYLTYSPRDKNQPEAP